MYKVVFTTLNKKPLTAYFDDIRKAYDFAEAIDGIVLHDKGERK